MEKVIINNKKEIITNNVFIENRNKVNVTGVTKVVSSNTKSVIVETSNGKMLIDGDNLHIDRLNVDDGVLDVSGSINSVKYAGKNEGLFKRLFK